MSRLWRALTRNLLLKLSALVCAVVVWVYVDGFLPARRTVRLTVGEIADMADACVDYNDEGGEIAIDPNDKIAFALEGVSRFVRPVGPSSIRYVGPSLDKQPWCTALAGGGELRPIAPEDFAVPGAPAVRIVSVEPNEIVLKPKPKE